MPRLAFGPVRAPNMPIFWSQAAFAAPPELPADEVSPPLVPQAPRASAATANGTTSLRVERTDVLLMSLIPLMRAERETRRNRLRGHQKWAIGDRVVTSVDLAAGGSVAQAGSGRREAVDDGLGDLFHPEPAVHRRLLDPPERIGLAELQLGHEHALGAVDELARLEAFAEVGDLCLEGLELLPARRGDVDGRAKVIGREGLDDVGHDAGVAGPLHELGLRERGEHDDRAQLGLVQLFGGGQAVEDRHLDIHDDEVGLDLLGQLDGLLAVAGLADDVVALLSEHLDEVETDEGLVLGDEDPGCPRPVGCGVPGLRRRCSLGGDSGRGGGARGRLRGRALVGAHGEILSGVRFPARFGTVDPPLRPVAPRREAATAIEGVESAEGGTRTRTTFRPEHFECPVSAIPPPRPECRASIPARTASAVSW